MRLCDYMRSGGIDYSDQIFLSKFENLFNELSSRDNVMYYVANHHKTTNDLFQIFENIKKRSEKIKLLMINPDIDFPFIKDNFIKTIENEKYDQSIQDSWECQSMEHFLDYEIFDNIPENAEIFCHSNLVEHSGVNMIPLGRDFKGLNFIESVSGPFDKKNILCYVNFSTPPKFWHWYGRIRQHIADFADSNQWILKENTMPNNLRGIGGDFVKYYERLKDSKFMIAPRGCGLDTYRLWDSLYLGCVPIVINYSGKTGYNRFRDLPIYFLESWDDYLKLTPEKLEAVWNKMINTDYNFEKLKFSYWEKEIKNDKFF